MVECHCRIHPINLFVEKMEFTVPLNIFLQSITSCQEYKLDDQQ